MAQMAKKKQLKKHKLKHGEQEQAIQPVQKEAASKARLQSPASVPARAMTGSGTTTERDFSYVGADLRKILILAACLISAELVLWILFSHTGMGTKVYQVIQP